MQYRTGALPERTKKICKAYEVLDAVHPRRLRSPKKGRSARGKPAQARGIAQAGKSIRETSVSGNDPAVTANQIS